MFFCICTPIKNVNHLNDTPKAGDVIPVSKKTSFL